MAWIGLSGVAHSLALFQDASSSDMHSLVIWVAVSAISTAVIALGMLMAAVVALGAQKKAKAEIDELKKTALAEIAEIKAKVLPLVGEAHTLFTELTPEVKSISAKVGTLTSNLEAISGTVKDKLKEFEPTIDAARVTIDEANQTVRVANQKTVQQVDRVNGMVSSLLDTTQQMGKAVHHSITQPVREVSGIVGGVKAALLTFLNAKPKPRPEPVYKAPVGTYEPVETVTSYPGEKPDLEP